MPSPPESCSVIVSRYFLTASSELSMIGRPYFWVCENWSCGYTPRWYKIELTANFKYSETICVLPWREMGWDVALVAAIRKIFNWKGLVRPIRDWYHRPQTSAQVLSCCHFLLYKESCCHVVRSEESRKWLAWMAEDSFVSSVLAPRDIVPISSFDSGLAPQDHAYHSSVTSAQQKYVNISFWIDILTAQRSVFTVLNLYRFEQGQLLIMCLVERMCLLEQKDPDRSQKLLSVICRQLLRMEVGRLCHIYIFICC